MSSKSRRLVKRGHYTKHRDTKKKARKSSSTPGIMKVSSCHRAGWKNEYISSRGYKKKQYPVWCDQVNKMNK